MTEVFNVAIVGLNEIGQIHFDNFRSLENVKVLYCLDLDESLAKNVFKVRNLDSTGIVIPFSMFDFILRDKALNAIVINSPCESHYYLAKKSIELGIPVLMESPVSKNLKEVLELYDLAKRQAFKETSTLMRESLKKESKILDKFRQLNAVLEKQLTQHHLVSNLSPLVEA